MTGPAVITWADEPGGMSWTAKIPGSEVHARVTRDREGAMADEWYGWAVYRTGVAEPLEVSRWSLRTPTEAARAATAVMRRYLALEGPR